MIVGKNPSMVEKIESFSGFLFDKWVVRLLSSSAEINPRIVMVRAENLIYHGSVRVCILRGGRL